MDSWSLPERARIGGREYGLHTDYRDILEIFSYLQQDGLPEFIRWQIALALFYDRPVPEADLTEAAQYLARFISGGQPETAQPGPKLMDWQQDAAAIVADVNRVAGQEIRSLPYVHWWTFLSWFQSIGEGQLSTLVSIRDKLRRGKKLESHEQEFYRSHKDAVILRKKYSAEELAEREKWNRLLG